LACPVLVCPDEKSLVTGCLINQYGSTWLIPYQCFISCRDLFFIFFMLFRLCIIV
jgi:hypothetical protein